MKYLKYLKVPYKHLGRDFSGCDCLGLVTLFYKNEFGIELPAYTGYEPQWYLSDATQISRLYKRFGFTKVKLPLCKGDVLLLNEAGSPKHLAVVIEGGYMLHTVESGTCCQLYTQGIYSTLIHSAYRYTKGIIHADHFL